MITPYQLLEVFPSSKSLIPRYFSSLCSAMFDFGITTPLREAAFLAQIAVESGELKYVRELSSGESYEGRKDLGNTNPGDGVKFKGRGLIQITGRANYTAVMMALDIDCVDRPELLEEPINACRSAGWFWSNHNLNELADQGEFEKITKKINGGLNAQDRRLAYYEIAKKVLGV